MSAKNILFSDEARSKVLSGVTKLADAVRATMGPKGRNVLIARSYGGPTVTKDGVTVAREIELLDPYENMGAQLVKEAATKTNDAAGDGTTTATVLAHAMMQQGIKHLGSGANPILIKRGMEKATAAVTAHLDKIKKDISRKEEFAAVATISAQDAVIGEAVAGVIDQVGKDGIVTVEAGQTLGLEAEVVEGMQFDQGYISPYFVTDPARMEATYQRAVILVTDRKITSAQEILPLLELLNQKGKKELVIIAEGVEGEALAALVVNKLRGIFHMVAVKAPAFGDRRKEMLKDIAALTGATFISDEVGLKLEAVTIADLGTARTVVVTKDSTTIVDGGGKKEDIAARVGEIRGALETCKSEFDREKQQERLGKLTGGVAVLKVGAATEIEQKEKQHRVEDALSATRAAAEEGIVPGGGTAYIRALGALDALLETVEDPDEVLGIEIVRNSLSAPAMTIARNAGLSGEVVATKIGELKGNFGYNALTGKYEDLVKSMVIDPKKVARCALENAVSVAAMFLTLEVTIVDVPKEAGTEPPQM